MPKLFILALIYIFIFISQPQSLPPINSASLDSVSYQPKVLPQPKPLLIPTSTPAPTPAPIPSTEVKSGFDFNRGQLDLTNIKNEIKNEVNSQNNVFTQPFRPVPTFPENPIKGSINVSQNKVYQRKDLKNNDEAQTFRIQRCPSQSQRKMSRKNNDPQIINLNFRSYIEKYRSQSDPTSKVISDDDSEIWQVRSKFSEVNTFRELIYNKNLRKINSHNQNRNRKFNMGLNRFTLLDQLEFNRLYTTNMVVPSQPRISVFEIRKKIRQIETQIYELEKQKNKLQNYASSVQSEDFSKGIFDIKKVPTLLPFPRNEELTFRSKSVQFNSIIDWSCISSQIQIYNQGACGSCYAFATLDAIFITAKIQNKTVQPLSVQQILSCAKNDRSLLGCKGGYFTDVYNYVQSRGVISGLLYKYHPDAKEKGWNITCNEGLLNNFPALKYRGLKGSINIQKGDCNALIETLKTQAIAVAISTEGFQFYISGTFNSASNLVNHGVVLVGYYPQNGFLVKNSWGNAWGEGGYAFVSQQTGVCDYAVAPVL